MENLNEVHKAYEVIKKAESSCILRYRLGIGCDATNSEAVAKI
jgi:hypothetical protein